jgi:3-isopropylmalate/(R)-2-methylmalate dehydratase small subunit
MPGVRVAVDLESRSIVFEGVRATFPVDPFARRCLLDGTDELGFLLARQEAIAAHEAEELPCTD